MDTSASAPSCATHPGLAATGTCERCGSFLCPQCAPGAPKLPDSGVERLFYQVHLVSHRSKMNAQLCSPCRHRVVNPAFAPCPYCGVQNAARVRMTYWGGLLGPWLFTHVRCGSCAATYNGKTGKSNVRPILTYVGIVFGALALLILWAGLGAAVER